MEIYNLELKECFFIKDYASVQSWFYNEIRKIIAESEPPKNLHEVRQAYVNLEGNPIYQVDILNDSPRNTYYLISLRACVHNSHSLTWAHNILNFRPVFNYICHLNNLNFLNDNYVYHYSDSGLGFASIKIMHKNGISFCRIYWYHTDRKSVYFDSISVDESSRRQGIGNEMLKIMERISLNLGAETSFLWCNKLSFVWSWYRHNGYEKLKEHQEKDCEWMYKSLTT